MPGSGWPRTAFTLEVDMSLSEHLLSSRRAPGVPGAAGCGRPRPSPPGAAGTTPRGSVQPEWVTQHFSDPEPSAVCLSSADSSDRPASQPSRAPVRAHKLSVVFLHEETPAGTRESLNQGCICSAQPLLCLNHRCAFRETQNVHRDKHLRTKQTDDLFPKPFRSST